ncbi:MAG: hypothetical protein WBQ26_13950 [Gemmatimonadaceae bacterium]|nr:hypothetical protein [Gemmatimonadaceae bacterium]
MTNGDGDYFTFLQVSAATMGSVSNGRVPCAFSATDSTGARADTVATVYFYAPGTPIPEQPVDLHEH